jgi:hypothetical protein
MKGKIFFGITFLGIVLLAGACNITDDISITNQPNNQVPPTPNKYLVTISAEDFNKESPVMRQAEEKTGDTFTVALDSNATTGFNWTEQAKITDGNILNRWDTSILLLRQMMLGNR